MTIKLATSKKKRAGYRLDPKRNQYITYKIDGRIGGKRFRQGGFLTRKSAQEFIDATKLANKYKRAGVKHVTHSPRLSELLNKRLTKIKNRAERMRGERIFRFFQSLFIGDPKVTEVSSGDFQLFINEREQAVKKETVNREVNLLSKAFRSASELFPKELEGFEVPKIPRPKFKRKRREKIITPDEKDVITKELYKTSIRIARMFEIAWFLGMAYKEVEQLKKTAYNGIGLEFVRSKTGNTVVFEWLPDEVHQILKAAIADSKTEFVFTTGSTPKDFYKIMRSAVESVGLPYGRDRGITFHSARHSFVTTAMQHGDLKTVGSMSGHTDETMVLLYTHASPESRKKVLQSMYSKLNLRDIFDRVRSGKLTFSEFEKLI